MKTVLTVAALTERHPGREQTKTALVKLPNSAAVQTASTSLRAKNSRVVKTYLLQVRGTPFIYKIHLNLKIHLNC